MLVERRKMRTKFVRCWQDTRVWAEHLLWWLCLGSQAVARHGHEAEALPDSNSLPPSRLLLSLSSWSRSRTQHWPMSAHPQSRHSQTSDNTDFRNVWVLMQCRYAWNFSFFIHCISFKVTEVQFMWKLDLQLMGTSPEFYVRENFIH